MLKPKKKPAAVSALVMILMMVLAVGCFTTACMKDTDRSTTPDVGLEAVQVTEATVETELKKTIFVDPVGTSERAIEIAKKFNISGADSFTYQGLNTSSLLDAHEVQADDDTETRYSIYDINGEIASIQTDMNVDNQPISITKEEAEADAQEYVKTFYGDVELTVRMVEVNGDTGYFVIGTIYKDSEGSVRDFRMSLNGSGELIFMSAEYDAIYALNISDEMVAKAKSYAIDISEPVQLMDIFQEFGVQIYEFYFEEGSMMVDLNAEDGSLVRISLGNLDIGDTFTMDEEQAKRIALDYIAEYFPEATDVAITSQDFDGGAAMYMGTLNKGSVAYNWDIAFNNESELWYAEIMRNNDYSTMEKMDIDDAEQTARDMAYQECPFITDDELVLDKAYESVSENTPDQYIFEFSYQSKKPSVTDYSFTMEVGVNKYTGDYGTLGVFPSTEGIDVLSQDELIAKAKEYLVDAYKINPDKLKFRDMYIVGGRILEYDLSFDYVGNVSYGCSMVADSGELDGVMEGASLPTMTESQLGYDIVAGLTGDYIDMDITYVNEKTKETYTYTVDNAFCWAMEFAPWDEAGQEEVSGTPKYSEYIDILGCQIVKTKTGLTLYYEGVLYTIDTDPAVFDAMVEMIKSK